MYRCVGWSSVNLIELHLSTCSPPSAQIDHYRRFAADCIQCNAPAAFQLPVLRRSSRILLFSCLFAVLASTVHNDDDDHDDDALYSNRCTTVNN